MYEGRVLLVTGSSRGIGNGLCRHFLEHGGRTIGFSRSPSTLSHENYQHFSLDITDSESVTRAFYEIRQKYGAPDVLINNAAVLTSQYSLLMTPESAKSMLLTNTFGAFLVARESAKLMLKKKFGRIVHISSMGVPLAPPGDSIYSASKSALEQFSRVFAKEIIDYNITSNVLGISAIETDMLTQIPKPKLDEVMESLPISSLATLSDITNVVDFFAREQSGGITGQVMYLGGVS